MSLYDVLDQIVALLRQRQRLTYRLLQREFALDDETLEDLKAELIQAQRLAIDEDGAVLVWTGEIEGKSEPASQPNQPEPQSIVEHAQPVQEPSSPVEPYTPDAERRQLTVMFVDLVGSTSLSGELDAEDLREVIRSYQAACTEVITRYDGHVAQLLGDGLLVYFGFPSAHEDDARRSVHTGLEILNVVETLNTRLASDKGIKLAVRLGIHTGLVVVGEMGGEGRQEQLAMGETPNVAARIQGLAEPDTVVISADTHSLVQGYFDCDALGEHDLRGVSQSIAVYRVLQESGAQNRLDVVSRRGLTPLIGRESESTLLFERWAQAKDGQGQVVLLSGEAGIGKSRLVQAFKDHVSEAVHTGLECRSSPYFTNSALYPITDLLQRMLRFQTDDTPEQRLEKLEQNLSLYHLPLEESVQLFAPLLSLSIPENRYPPSNVSPQRQRQKTLETIVAILLELSEQQPVLFILEDLHWTDPTTLELLELLIDQTPVASLYALLTCRPEFQPSWQHRSYLTEVTVNRLSRNQIERLAEQVSGGKSLPTDVLQQLVEKTDGVPLYVEEMTKSVLESGVLKDVGDEYELSVSISSLAIPATLQDSLMSRLDRLMTAKVVAQLGAAMGRQFGYELLHAVAQLDEPTLQRELGRLVEAELVYQRGLPPHATYTFKHALIQDIAYESLLRSTRQGYHRRIAEVLEAQFPEAAKIQPELLAHHCMEGGLNEQAVIYWQQAGENAIQRSANTEAIAHLTKGLELLETLPESPTRLRQELDFHVALGPALMATMGHAALDVERAYARARELCQQIGDTPKLFQVLRGLWHFYLLRMELQTARELGEALFALAQDVADLSLRLEAHYVLGNTLNYLAEFTAAQAHFEQGINLYDFQRHRDHAFRYGLDPGISCRIYAAFNLWCLGYPDQAVKQSHEGLTLGHERAHLYSLAFALFLGTWVHQFRREWHHVQERAQACIDLTAEHGFMLFRAGGTILWGWALTAQPPEPSTGQAHIEAGIAQIEQGLTAWHATGAEVLRPYGLALLAEAHLRLGQHEDGLALLPEALAVTHHTGERRWEAELHRIKGELLLAQGPDAHTEAACCFQQAISIAQNQSAKSWELRAATSLARLWQSQGRQDEAHDLLDPVYNWFTEGFDTADLIDAKALLDELS